MQKLWMILLLLGVCFGDFPSEMLVVRHEQGSNMEIAATFLPTLHKLDSIRQEQKMAELLAEFELFLDRVAQEKESGILDGPLYEDSRKLRVK